MSVAGTAKTAMAGAAATATAKPPARISRRAECWKVAIVTLSVVIDHVVGMNSMEAAWFLHSFREFPANDLRAGADGRAGDDRRPHGRLVLCQAVALAR